MKKNSLPSVVGGLTLFAWGFLSHAVLPWYGPVYRSFTDEARVLAVLEETGRGPGVYYLPADEVARGPDRTEAFVNLVPSGAGTAPLRQAVVGLAIAVVSAALVNALVSRMRPPTYMKSVACFSAVGAAIAFVSHAYYWNWFQFSSLYIGVTMLDTITGWTLVGMTVAPWLVTRERP